MPIDSWINLKVFNVLAQEVSTLADRMQTASYKSVEWDANNYPNGVYMYQIISDKYINTKKLLVTNYKKLLKNPSICHPDPAFQAGEGS
ncbi:MAG: T9SS type A sorting domain-containing protein [Ignavibacteriales bacterium]|nr:T9SS type A sorting domain-containing protein [Ignavibacteriales bacterium]